MLLLATELDGRHRRAVCHFFSINGAHSLMIYKIVSYCITTVFHCLLGFYLESHSEENGNMQTAVTVKNYVNVSSNFVHVINPFISFISEK